MSMYIRLIFPILLFLLAIPAKAQLFHEGNGLSGIPKTTHFSRDDFHGASQFWAMTTDKQGVRYFGNNDGILIFDGERWQKVELPNNSSVRCLVTTKTGKVYAGGFNDIGTIEKDSLGNYFYRSLLKDLKLENDHLGNLWQVHQLKKCIIYRSFNELLVLSNGVVTHIPSVNQFTHADIVHGNYYIQDINQGIFKVRPKSAQLDPIFKSSQFDHQIVVGLLPHKSNKNLLIIATKSGWIYRGNIKTGEVKKWLSVFEGKPNTDEIITAIAYKNSYFFGTLSSKIISLSSKGELNKNPIVFANLFDSSVLNLYKEKDNIWSLLNNGLDFIEFDSPVSILFDKASVYDILVEPKTIYLATNKGVFYAKLLNGNKITSLQFNKIPGLNGQAWSVQKRNGDILVGHDKGLFSLKNNMPIKIGKEGGFWKVIPIKDKPNFFLAANYNGLYLITNKDSTWKIVNKLKGFGESSRDILPAKEKNTYWICHGYKGVFKIKINDKYSRIYALEHYTDQNGFSSPFNINVFNWNSDIVFTTNTGIYSYQKNKNIFKPYAQLNTILDTARNTRQLIQHGKKTWFVQDDEIGYFKTADSIPKLHKGLFLNIKGKLNRGMESIVPLGDGQVLIGATNGLYLYNTNQPVSTESQTKLTQVSYTKRKADSLLSLYSNNQIIELPNEPELIRFEFSAPKLSLSTTVQYQYILKGIDRNWSKWTSKPYKEYTHLRPGDYIFKVQSRDLNGDTGQEASYAFSIPPVWYRTTLAIIIYISIALALIMLITKIIKNKIDRERRKSKIDAQRSKRMLELEIEQLKLMQEKDNIREDKLVLEESNKKKSKELANYTMLLVKKKEVFSDTYNKLKELKKSSKNTIIRKEIQTLILELHQHKIGEEFMQVFDVNFESVHKNFFQKLKTLYPNLTKRELRLCAFVKMDLSNKEIAPLLNISVRGVETARYRVRKKLNVQDVNFLSFLEELSNAA